MKVLFWNIGEPLSNRKLELIKKAISGEHPDIFCIAEGSPKKKDCENLVNFFAENGYYCYYSPLFCQRTDLKLSYTTYNEYGLKIFVQEKRLIKEEFSFPYERMNGRIVVVKTYIKFIPTTFIFLHCKSKGGSRKSTEDQHAYLMKLRDMIDKNVGKITDNTVDPENMGKKERVIIIGDFNIEPWESAFNNKHYLITSFYRNHNLMKQRKKQSNSIFFNPSAEFIFKTDIENLGGTYYTDNNEWALFDFILFDTKDGEVKYNIITEFDDNSELLNKDKNIKKSFLNDGLDHLPIVAEINNEI